MPTINDLMNAFPEFNGQNRNLTLIQAKLNEATLQIDSCVWGAYTAMGVLYLAAHLLATSPFGQNAKLVAKDGETVYSKNYRRLLRTVTAGYRNT